VPVACPFCGSMVEPFLDARGQRVCPVCRNMGTPSASAAPLPPPPNPPWNGPPAAPFVPPGAPPSAYGPQPNAPGAVASLVLGILGLVFTLYGVVFAILALVFGYRAKRLIAASAGRLGGAGLAQAGRILGWIWVALVPILIVLAAVVFVLVTKVSGAAAHLEGGVQVDPGRAAYVAVPVPSDGATVHFSYSASGASAVTAALVRSQSAGVPAEQPGGPAWAGASGPDGEGTAVLLGGDYSLRLRCDDADPCDVQYALDVQPEGTPTPDVLSWTTSLNGNPATDTATTPDSVQVAGSGGDSPYVATELPAGDFWLAFDAQHPHLAPYGVGLVVLDDQGREAFRFWGDSDHAVAATLGGNSIPLASGPHRIVLAVAGRHVTLTVDDRETLTAALPGHPARLWVGHPSVGELNGLRADGTNGDPQHLDGQGVVTSRWWPQTPGKWSSIQVSDLEMDRWSGSNDAPAAGPVLLPMVVAVAAAVARRRDG